MTNWTEQGFIGKMFKAISRFVARTGMPTPALWGDEGTVRERFSTGYPASNSRGAMQS
jgi:hypothetical protein